MSVERMNIIMYLILMRVTLNVCRWISTIRRIRTSITVTGRDSRTLTRILAAIKWDWDPPNTKLMYNRWLRWGSVQVGTFKIILQNLVCMHIYVYVYVAGGFCVFNDDTKLLSFFSIQDLFRSRRLLFL